MRLIDTHTHLYLPEFDADREEVIKRANEKGIDKMLLPNIDPTSIGPMLNLTTQFPDYCFPMMGLHPTSVKANFTDELDVVRDQLTEQKYIAIGEVGIDLYWDKTFQNEQVAAFKEQIDLSLDYKLPLVIHSRNSMDLIISIIKEFHSSGVSGVFHSFTGSIEQAQEIVQLGFTLGIGGIVTFKNANLDEVVKQIDLDHIILETDSPYLAPVPNRGKRNESANIIYIAQKIADIKEKEIGYVADVTTRNAEKLFDLTNLRASH